jgi:hypothetical protein
MSKRMGDPSTIRAREGEALSASGMLVPDPRMMSFMII